MHRCIVSIGSNREAHIHVATAMGKLKILFPETIFSTPQLTAPIGMQNPAQFLNCIAKFATTMQKEKVILSLKSIETEIGRDRIDKENINIDLDLICFDDVVLKSKDLQYEHVQDGLKELNIEL